MESIKFLTPSGSQHLPFWASTTTLGRARFPTDVYESVHRVATW